MAVERSIHIPVPTDVAVIIIERETGWHVRSES